jgi:hypothetical protein
MALQNIGNQTVGGSNVQGPIANDKVACRFQNTTGSTITVKTLTFFCQNFTGKMKAIIYSDVSSAPSALLATSTEMVNPATGYNTLTFPTPLAVANSAYIWIGVIGDTTSTSGSTSLASGQIDYNANTYTSGPSNPFGAGPTTAAFTYVEWVEGDDGGLTLGRASVDAGTGTVYVANTETADQFTLGGSASYNATSISVRIGTTSATANCIAGIYSDSSGVPGTLLGTTAQVTGTTTGTWLTLTFGTPVTLSPGTYWLAFLSDTTLASPSILSGGQTVTKSRAESLGLLATGTSWSGTSIAPRGLDIYATLTIAGVTATAATDQGQSVSGSELETITSTAATAQGQSVSGSHLAVGGTASTAQGQSATGSYLGVTSTGATDQGQSAAGVGSTYVAVRRRPVIVVG